jgi:serine protease Do
MKLHEKIILAILAAALLTVGILILLKEQKSEAGVVYKTDGLQQNFAEVAEKCIPAVVVIRTGRSIHGHPAYSDPYEDLYNYFYGGKAGGRKVQTGQGSGFFIRADGYIMTNFHIVNGQDYFTIALADGREFESRIIGADPLSDLALLKIDAAEKFPYLEFADTDNLKTGHWAIAIGAPFSLSHTVTAGIVSHKKRTVGLNVHENFIQTDASVNPGNSGGPLLNLEGKVIGVNDFIISPSAGNIGLSFAIDGNLSKKISGELMARGRVERPWIGISMAEISARHKKMLNLKSGVAALEVVHGAPAHRAGVKAEDIIVAVDGKPVNQPQDAQNAILDHKPGDTLKMTISRESKLLDITVQTETMPVNRFYKPQLNNAISY